LDKIKTSDTGKIVRDGYTGVIPVSKAAHMQTDPYKQLAERLDALPNGFPAAQDGIELRLLEKLYSPGEAGLAAQLGANFESAEQVAERTGGDPGELRQQLKGMSRRGLIEAARSESGLSYRLLPFVVGIYEMQVNSMDAELAALFERYFMQAFGETLRVKPQVHRVIPIGESVRNSMEVHPFESASDLVNTAQAWGVLDCICRKQKALIGQPCEHPIDVCMVLEQRPGAFDHSKDIRMLTRDQALGVLRRASEAGLVHSVSNNQQGVHYICNCCTCSCGILRGMANLGIANVVARSAFVNQVDDLLCSSCGICIDTCPFDALSMDSAALVDGVRCVGCGVCVLNCPNEAMGLVRRPEAEIMPVPETIEQWGERRSAARGM
jgi:ferredoxin